MKKKILLFLLCILLLNSVWLPACHPSPSTPEQEEETDTNGASDYFYYVESRTSTLYKTNIKTKVSSPVCEDPLCKHAIWSSCLYTDIHVYKMVGDYVLFVRLAGPVSGNLGLTNVYVCSYNTGTGEYTQYEYLQCTDKEEPCGGLEMYDGYLYYYYEDYIDGEFCMSMRRINMETKEREELDVHTQWVHRQMYNGRLYRSNGHEFYHTDMLHNDKQVVFTGAKEVNVALQHVDENGDIYYLERPAGKQTIDTVFTLKKYDVKTGESTAIDSSKHFSNIVSGNGKLYYTKSHLNAGGLLRTDPQVYVWSGGEPEVFYETENQIRSLRVTDSYVAIVCLDPDAKPDPQDPDANYPTWFPIFIELDAAA